MFKKLEKNIPKTGSMKYNSANIMPYRQEIDKLVDKLLEKMTLISFLALSTVSKKQKILMQVICQQSEQR